MVLGSKLVSNASDECYLMILLPGCSVTGVSLPSDLVVGEPLLAGATGGHGPVSHLHPGREAAEQPPGPSHLRTAAQPKRK